MLTRYYLFLHRVDHWLASIILYHLCQPISPSDEAIDDLPFSLLITQFGDSFVQGLFFRPKRRFLSSSLSPEDLQRLIVQGRQLLERQRLHEAVLQLQQLEENKRHSSFSLDTWDELAKAHECLAELIAQLEREQIPEDSLFTTAVQMYARLLGGQSLERYVFTHIYDRERDRSQDLSLGL